MNNIVNIQWNHDNYRNRFRPSSNSKELVTLRASNTHSRKIILYISIGLHICDVLDLKKGERINVYLHKNDKNKIMIKKCIEPFYGLKMHYSRGNFLHLSFTIPFDSNIKIKKTVVSNWDITQNSELIIDLTNIKWKI